MKKSKIWIIPDGYLPNPEIGKGGPTGYFSHESLCILNDSNRKVKCNLIVYFEDAEPIKDFNFVVEPERSLHFRLDKAVSDSGKKIPIEKPYSLKLLCDVPVYVQHSRLDCTQPNATLMTTIGIPGK